MTTSRWFYVCCTLVALLPLSHWPWISRHWASHVLMPPKVYSSSNNRTDEVVVVPHASSTTGTWNNQALLQLDRERKRLRYLGYTQWTQIRLALLLPSPTAGHDPATYLVLGMTGSVKGPERMAAILQTWGSSKQQLLFFGDQDMPETV